MNNSGGKKERSLGEEGAKGLQERKKARRTEKASGTLDQRGPDYPARCSEEDLGGKYEKEGDAGAPQRGKGS